ncbi:Hypothetical_protein [Hexamita inflata]|uniref:Hypothetical_protein n=1 Tax=Hexamita inflata TaxID=28002 RepID=A0AA86Q6E5_9EUKA|nr:Hypothetical protein HINF_LOCUS39086 [Hexamita inflata]
MQQEQIAATSVQEQDPQPKEGYKFIYTTKGLRRQVKIITPEIRQAKKEQKQKIKQQIQSQQPAGTTEKLDLQSQQIFTNKIDNQNELCQKLEKLTQILLQTHEKEQKMELKQQISEVKQDIQNIPNTEKEQEPKQEEEVVPVPVPVPVPVQQEVPVPVPVPQQVSQIKIQRKHPFFK